MYLLCHRCYTIDRVGKDLGITGKGVKYHLASIHKLLGVHNNSDISSTSALSKYFHTVWLEYCLRVGKDSGTGLSGPRLVSNTSNTTNASDVSNTLPYNPHITQEDIDELSRI